MVSIERVIEEFVVWQIGIIPGAKFKVKITEHAGTSLNAIPIWRRYGLQVLALNPR